MSITTQKFFLLVVGILFSMFGCARERGDILMPDDISPPMEVHEDVDVEATFEQNLLPILTARCALSGCHVADGPHGLDFRTYQSFVAGGEHGPVFIPGNAEESEIVEEIVEGKMPPPPRDLLTDAEIQLFVDWINQQESHGDIVPHDDAHDADHDDADHDDADHEGDDDIDDAHDADIDADHEGDDDDDHDVHDNDDNN